MRLNEAKIGADIPILPPELRKHIHITTTCELLPTELEAMEQAFSALLYGLRITPPISGKMQVTMIATDKDTISLTFLDPDTIGSEFSLILLAIHRWRARNFDSRMITQCCLEEFCHFFWDLPDGDPVQLKVTELMQSLYSNLQREQLYNVSASPGNP